MNAFLRAISLLTLSIGLNACVTQIVTTPAQVATQSTQTAAQTAGQAAQVAIPDSDELTTMADSSLAQSKAQSKAHSNTQSESAAGFLSLSTNSSQEYQFDAEQETGDGKKLGRSNRK